MKDVAQILNEAYDLIEAGDLTRARQILDPLRAQAQNDPDFWWVYSHAVEDKEEGRNALTRVLELEPNYRGAKDLAELIGLHASSKASPRPIAPPTLPDLPKKDEFADFDADFDPDFDETEKEKSGGMARIFIAIALVLLVIVLAIFLLPNLLGTPTPPATQIVDSNTAIASQAVETEAIASPEVMATSDAVATDELVTEASTATEEVATHEIIITVEVLPFDTESAEVVITDEAGVIITNTPENFDAQAVDLVSELADYNVPADGVNELTTALGTTLVIKTCTVQGPPATTTISAIATVLTQFADDISPDIQAIAFSITDCQNNIQYNLLAVPRSRFDELVAGTITVTQFRSYLRPIG